MALQDVCWIGGGVGIVAGAVGSAGVGGSAGVVAVDSSGHTDGMVDSCHHDHHDTTMVVGSHGVVHSCDQGRHGSGGHGVGGRGGGLDGGRAVPRMGVLHIGHHDVHIDVGVAVVGHTYCAVLVAAGCMLAGVDDGMP